MSSRLNNKIDDLIGHINKKLEDEPKLKGNPKDFQTYMGGDTKEEFKNKLQNLCKYYPRNLNKICKGTDNGFIVEFDKFWEIDKNKDGTLTRNEFGPRIAEAAELPENIALNFYFWLHTIAYPLKETKKTSSATPRQPPPRRQAPRQAPRQPPPRRPPPAPTFKTTLPSSSSPTPRAPPPSPRTQTSSNFISRKNELNEIFKTKVNKLKQGLKEAKDKESVQNYIKILCNNINDVKLQSINVNTHEGDMLKYLYKINLFNTILLDPIFENIQILKDKSFKLLLQNKHQTNIDEHINGLCNDINNLIRRNNNNNTTYNNRILDFCKKLKEFLKLLKEIKDGIKRDLDKETLQEEYMSQKKKLYANTSTSLNSTMIEELRKELQKEGGIIGMVKKKYGHVIINDIVVEKINSLNNINNNENIKQFMNFKMKLTLKQINDLYYLYDEIMSKNKATSSGGDRTIQTLKRVIFKHLTYDIKKILPNYEYLEAEEVYKGVYNK